MFALRSAASVLFLVSLAASARAEYSRDRAARAMIDKAINEDYLRTALDRAESVLTGTIRACEDKCAPLTIARAWMYVGIVRGSGHADAEGAREAFDRALEVAKDVELDADLATDQTRSSWQQAQQSLRPSPPIAEHAVPRPAPQIEPRAAERERCPPGLPGCAEEGDRCESSSECRSGLSCGPAPLAAKSICQKLRACADDSECASGSCQRGLCALKSKPTESDEHRNWLGLYGALDFAKLPQQADACGGLHWPSRYECYGADRPYDASGLGHATPGIKSGFVRSTLRALLGFEHAFGSELRVGGRAGFAFLGSAQGFLPVHAELRLSYAPRVLRVGRVLAPYAFAGGGVAQVDARFPLQVNTAPTGDAESYRELDAVAVFGRNFGAWGAGLRLSPSDEVELDVGLSTLALFPDFGLVLQPSAGLVIGL